MSIVAIQNLTKRFDETTALDNVNLEIEEDEVFGLLGPNGSGKTTLFRTVMGQIAPTDGSVTVFGKDAYRETFDINKRVSFLPADIRFYGNLTARQNMRYLSRLAGHDPDIDELLDLVELDDAADRKVRGFSHGMQKRLGIAQTMIKDPDLILFDEPTVGLDPERKEDFKDLIRRINEERNVTVVVSSHILHEIEDICDRIGILKDGTIEKVGAIDDLVGSSDELILSTDDMDALEDILEDLGMDYTVGDGEATVKEDDEETREDLMERIAEEGIVLTTAQPSRTSLEDVYLSITR